MGRVRSCPAYVAFVDAHRPWWPVARGARPLTPGIRTAEPWSQACGVSGGPTCPLENAVQCIIAIATIRKNKMPRRGNWQDCNIRDAGRWHEFPSRSARRFVIVQVVALLQRRRDWKCGHNRRLELVPVTSEQTWHARGISTPDVPRLEFAGYFLEFGHVRFPANGPPPRIRPGCPASEGL